MELQNAEKWLKGSYNNKLVLENNIVEESIQNETNESVIFEYIGLSQVTILGKLSKELKEKHKNVICMYKFETYGEEHGPNFLCYGLLFKDYNKYIDTYLNLSGLEYLYSEDEEDFQKEVLAVVNEFSKTFKKNSEIGITSKEAGQQFGVVFDDFKKEVLKLENIHLKNMFKEII